MTDDEINEIVSRLLQERFGDAGFVRSTVASEEDFDGSSILRVTAYFDRSRDEVPRDWLNSLHDIQSELLTRGEARFVFLDGDYLQKEEVVDEDEG